MNRHNVQIDVKKILEYNHAARNDDMKLYACYVYEKIQGLNMGAGWLSRVFDEKKLREQNNIANYESVTRTRRYLQRIYPNLRADEEVRKGRAEKEADYHEFYREHRG